MVRIVLSGFIFSLMFSPISVFAEESSFFIYKDNGKRDPLLPLVSSSGVFINFDEELIISDLSLEGIIVDVNEDKNIAIINGQIVEKNSFLGGFKLLRISDTQVFLRKGSEDFILKLKRNNSYE